MALVLGDAFRAEALATVETEQDGLNARVRWTGQVWDPLFLVNKRYNLDILLELRSLSIVRTAAVRTHDCPVEALKLPDAGQTERMAAGQQHRSALVVVKLVVANAAIYYR